MTVGEILDSARTHLDDDGATLWTDPKLLPKFREAHREMEQRLALAGTPVIRDTTIDITVLEGTTSLNIYPDYPNDLIIEPTWLKEKKVDQLESFFTPMLEVDIIPQDAPSEGIHYWAWIRDELQLKAATTDRVVRMGYLTRLVTPQTLNQLVEVRFSELFLSYKVAAIALNSVGKSADIYEYKANGYLERIISLAVKNSQSLPARRIGYRNRFRRGNFNWI